MHLQKTIPAPLPILSLLLVMLTACRAADPARRPEVSPWPDRAEQAQAALLDLFFDELTGLYNISHPNRESKDPLMYWWQAHTIDALVDGYERSHDQAYLDRAVALWDSVKRHNGAPTNQYYDDMEWMALALLRLHAHTGDDTLRADIDTLWADIKTGWNDQHAGGIAWRKTQPGYKNAPANAPAAILAARLYQQSRDPEDLAWAEKIYSWLTDHLVDPGTGFVWDGVNRKGDGRTDKTWAFSYNQGTRIGAAVELYRATGEARYLRDARRTFDSAIARLADDRGLIAEPGGGDRGLFKGIFFRYVALWADANPHTDPHAGPPTDPPTDTHARPDADRCIRRHSEDLWQRIADRDPLLAPPDWTGAGDTPVDLSVQLSAVMLLEQMAARPPTTTD
ncbi:MAG: AGE family epimerase/isomerase [Phycisphaerales bacterium]|nr:AGE family epimerase/isomerase [Phycisphaerales bacterium]